MASRSAGTLLTEFNAAYVPPGLMPGYQGHVPGVAFSFSCPYGTATLKSFQDHRNAALERAHAPRSSGGHFPTLYSPNPDLVLCYCAQAWDRFLHTPSYTRFNLDLHRSTGLHNFYQEAQKHREQYRDRTGLLPRVPYFVLPIPEPEHYPLPTDLPPLNEKDKWHLLRMSPQNMRTYQTFPSGKRVSPQERNRRDLYFEFRA
ncbi:ciliary microtubule inner protein 2C [Erinaceus europaeus]|uniref:Ciliary microtubule inner protein 2C n=1 Tax=Erinaceus europaeus TaxID=9365 RepID=A0A1S3ABZ5_ERIEU|nr:ciliary microtubule inner protein 2C [Erinaceus europaeus]